MSTVRFRFFAVLALLLALGLSGLFANSASAHSIASVRPHNAPTTAAKPFAGSGNLTYHNGPVMRSNTTYAIYWIPSGYGVSSKYESTINGYFQNVAADSGK